MKKIISFLACILFLQSSAQTITWSKGDHLNGMYSYSQTTNKVDSNGNVYLFFSSDPSRYSTSTLYIEKYTPQGTLDTNFGTNGVLNINTFLGYPSTEEPRVYSFEVTDNDKPLLFIATEDGGSPKLLRLNANGTPDQSFGVSGIKYIFTDTSKYSSHYRSDLVKTNGKYFIFHNYSDLQNKPKTEIGCFNESGELITGIFDQGLKQIDYGTPYNYTQLESLTVAGPYLYAQGIGYPAMNRRISKIDTSSGIQDNSYPDNLGLYLMSSNDNIFPDGKTVVGRSITVSPSRTDLELKRYLADGSVDPSFGTNGVKRLGYPWIALDFANIVSLPNGDFLVGIYYVSTASSGGKQNALIYIKNNGEVKDSFGGNIPNNGVPIPGIFGMGSYATPASYTLKPDYIVVTSSRTYMGASLTTAKVSFNYSTLSADEVSKSYTFSFHPNPVKSVGTLTVKDNSEASFSLSDSSGKLVFRNKVFRNKTEIDFSTLTSGVYYLNVKQKDKESTQKIIKE
ncbi:T9SS type A sorting domain-containing protein [Chryseobacterium sp.]|uniref:T9SS type A sorting domain-containing protein n=1 Tax=Chryseobacterium sp. TaxID=1871047 RepID=UPI000ED75414|nr:T9SS type A sorting domain-containing protein [Chryseobacterium sp.]HCA07797.1 hypothetical protein [Chryseobacterium sp.]